MVLRHRQYAHFRWGNYIRGPDVLGSVSPVRSATLQRMHVRMAEHEQLKSDIGIRPAPPNLTASAWRLFGFHKVECKKGLDRSHTVRKVCSTTLMYLGNATNMRNYISSFHLELDVVVVVAKLENRCAFKVPTQLR